MLNFRSVDYFLVFLSLSGYLVFPGSAQKDYSSNGAAYVNGGSTASGTTDNTQCRCLSNDTSCFPSGSVLTAFNNTIGGRLIAPKPFSYPCYASSFNSIDCRNVQTNISNGFYRSDQPGAMQQWNWEEDGEKRCPLETASDTNAVCQMGRVPTFGVQVSSVADVQATVRFAQEHNLRLFVKTTGHDYAGRSAAVGSFLLWMHHYKSIETNPSFVPTGCSVAAVPAVTLRGGVQLRDAYAQVSSDTNNQYVMVGGMCPSVGAAGGYPLAGGHSPIGPSFGLAVDNVLQFDIVTADEALHTVNQCSEPDLFYALRGGGSGTFGVTTAVTYRLHPQPPAWTSFQVNFSPNPAGSLFNTTQMKKIFLAYARQAERIDANRWGGYFEINIAVGFAGTFLIPQTLDVATQSINAFLAEFQPMVSSGEAMINPRIKVQPNFEAWWSNHIWPATDFGATGFRGILGGRLLPTSAFSNPEALAESLYQGSTKVDDFLALVVSGQGVRERDVDNTETAVAPSWRKSFLDTVFLQLWADDTPDSAIQAKADALQGVLDQLSQAYPEAGAYFSESYAEKDYRNTYWGNANYAKLLQIKKKYDPKGFFTCTQCVGSEDWSADGNCPATVTGNTSAGNTNVKN